MKIIDQKGKLFGLINVVDLLIILVILLAGIGVLKYKDIGAFMSKISADASGNVYVTYSISGVKEVSVEGVSSGDIFFDEDSRQIIGEVVDKSATHTQIATTDKDGKFVYSEIPDRFDLLIKIKAKGSWNDLEIIVNNNDIQIGEKQEISSRMSNFSAVIYGIETE
ncbi:MAG: DUF4330 domain-containing protein [Clostridia bacterium]|nr:DUF4330 domain-containing protein [Clostridia bacterium]